MNQLDRSGSKEAKQTKSSDNPDGVILELGVYPPDAVITTSAIARIFKRSPKSIKNAVDRGELPPPMKLFGEHSWTVKSLVIHMECRMEEAKREREEVEARIRASQ